MEQTLIAQLLKDAKAYCDDAGVSISTLGVKIFNDSHFFHRLDAGSDCKTRSWERCYEYFKDNPVERAA